LIGTLLNNRILRVPAGYGALESKSGPSKKTPVFLVICTARLIHLEQL